MARERNSNLELLRLVAMFCIILYHFIGYFITPIDNSPFYEACKIIFHIGVVLFILISGYFGINPKMSGLLKLLLMTFLYYVPVQLLFDFVSNQPLTIFFKDCLVLSYGPYWFMQTYILFYLFVPILNNTLFRVSNNHKLYLLGLFVLINVYFGLFTQSIIGLTGGKNILNFCMIYIIGHLFHVFGDKVSNIHTLKLVILFISYNIGLFIAECFGAGTMVEKIILRFCMRYNSPGLIFSASLLFLIFVRFNIQNKIINYISASILAVYLITDQTTLKHILFKPCVEYIYNSFDSYFVVIFVLSLFVLFIITLSIAIDKILSPVWGCVGLLPEKIKNIKICV